MNKLFLLLPLLLAACTDPVVVIPGGQLSGVVAEAPERWTSVADVVQLETRPSDPYSVNIWALVDQGNLYLATDKAQWLPHIAEDNRVRLSSDGIIYELAATPVTDPSEKASMLAAYKKKYNYDAEGNSMSSPFRLSKR